MSIRVEALDHVTINITDLDQAKLFYSGMLGLEEVQRPENFNFPGAWYRTSNVLIHLVGRPQPDAPSTRHFALRVTAINEAAAELKTAGYEVRWDSRKIHGIERFFSLDPDGNRIEFQGTTSILLS